MTEISKRLRLGLLCLLAAFGCTGGEQQAGQLQIKLPKPLREISGLTLLSDERLLAVGDEKAQIYSIDFATLEAHKFARMGDPVKKGDFEGIALLQDSIYLVTSNGKLWRRGLDTDDVDYEQFKTGIGKHCEVEGLTAWAEKNVLLILCKQARSKELSGRLSIFAWSPHSQSLDASLAINRSFKKMGLKQLHPSGITLSADQQRLFIVAAREQYFIETTLTGELIRAARLPNPGTHQQTEGVAISGSNTLYLADEGDKGRGTITRYEPSF